MKHIGILIVLAGSVLAQTKQPSLSGKINGTVTDQTGSPVAAATVYAVPQGLVLSDITLQSAKTDRNGHFEFRGGLELGSYLLYSRKDADAYPDPFDRFYADPKAAAPKAELTASHPAATVAVPLGKQAGVIAGKIVDANTGAPVQAMLGFVDGDGNGHSVSVDGDYRILVPPGKDVTLMVTIPGSQTDRTEAPVAPLRLEPGQHIYMDLPVSR